MPPKLVDSPRLAPAGRSKTSQRVEQDLAVEDMKGACERLPAREDKVNGRWGKIIHFAGVHFPAGMERGQG